MKKINLLLLFTLLIGTQYNINAAFGGSLTETDEERFERELVEAIERSQQENYGVTNDTLTEVELAQIAEAEAVAKAERLRQEEEEATILAEVLAASEMDQSGTAVGDNKESIAEEFARVAAERHKRVTKQLARQGGFLTPGEKPTISVKPRGIRIKKASTNDTNDLPAPPDEEWLAGLYTDGGDYGASAKPKKKDSTTTNDTEGFISELNDQWNKMFSREKKK